MGVRTRYVWSLKAGAGAGWTLGGRIDNERPRSRPDSSRQVFRGVPEVFQAGTGSEHFCSGGRSWSGQFRGPGGDDGASAGLRLTQKTERRERAHAPTPSIDRSWPAGSNRWLLRICLARPLCLVSHSRTVRRVARVHSHRRALRKLELWGDAPFLRVS